MVCVVCYGFLFFLFFKQKTAYEMRISDWSSDVCSSDLRSGPAIAFHNPMKFGALLLVQVSPLRHDIVPEHETDGRSDLAGANGKTCRADFSNHSVIGREGANVVI